MKVLICFAKKTFFFSEVDNPNNKLSILFQFQCDSTKEVSYYIELNGMESNRYLIYFRNWIFILEKLYIKYIYLSVACYYYCLLFVNEFKTQKKNDWCLF